MTPSPSIGSGEGFTLEEVLVAMPRKKTKVGDYPDLYIDGWNKCLAALKNNLKRMSTPQEPTEKI